mmetsp:Transcript_29086/g.69488  ORF Transcript_29086/g.69488 Transcript_29086/m.69488 type:complete len:123 (-) Transcript_29086:66-434(-)|eukprot:CAMPEP_0177581644 /NCGR_PEP_ID=MMETSP0419_2-20121207/2265_1 /TAXON_ID=582737 /ORGANISM="Tetraselmis sp., Strain GSL018" /LENGTH=122 /DNA_ID=CAMNT_0019070715 /DNA_START=175 /DNA_END=543 /DNA_ORIENTATION=-
MQAVASNSVRGVSLSRGLVRRNSTAAPRAAARVVCHAQLPEKVNKAAAAAMVAVSSTVAHPAFALVDQRLGGEGTGKALGINDSVLGWIILGVFTLVWTQFYSAQKDVDPNSPDDEDSGLTL